VGRLPLHIIVPITTGNPRFKTYFWMLAISASATNGLDNDSYADAFQVKSIALERFIGQRGTLTTKQLEEIAAAIALCIGYNPP
jgi:mRNA-degrading endonuclease toxin of MazEF toxin-antitoxin module